MEQEHIRLGSAPKEECVVHNIQIKWRKDKYCCSRRNRTNLRLSIPMLLLVLKCSLLSSVTARSGACSNALPLLHSRGLSQTFITV